MRECLRLIKKVQQDYDSVPELKQVFNCVLSPIRWKGGDCARIKFFSGRKNAGDFYQHFAA